MKPCDYLFLLPATLPLKFKISCCKFLAGDIIGPYAGINHPAHLTIIELPNQDSYLVRSWIRQLRPKINSLPPVTFHINNFGLFEHGEESLTIYAAIKPTYKTDNWLDMLKQQLKTSKPTVPHITITKTISYDNFLQLWPVFRHKQLQEKFMADRLLILEKETFNPSSKWQIYETLYFKNAPYQT